MTEKDPKIEYLTDALDPMESDESDAVEKNEETPDEGKIEAIQKVTASRKDIVAALNVKRVIYDPVTGEKTRAPLYEEHNVVPHNENNKVEQANPALGSDAKIDLDALLLDYLSDEGEAEK